MRSPLTRGSGGGGGAGARGNIRADVGTACDQPEQAALAGAGGGARLARALRRARALRQQAAEVAIVGGAAAHRHLQVGGSRLSGGSGGQQAEKNQTGGKLHSVYVCIL